MNIKPIFLVLVLLISMSPILPILAQDQMVGAQLFTIHEDVVNPSRVAEYEQAAKNLAMLMEENNITTMQYSAANSDDFVYIYISPILNYAGLEKMNEGFGELQEKIGMERFNNAMNRFNGNYHSHRDYLIKLHPELSYKPEYGNQFADGMNFRHWDFYHVYPGKENEIESIAKEWITLNKSNDIEQGYRLYLGDMGTDMPLVIVAYSAKSASDFYMNREMNMAKLGEAGKKLMEKTMSITWKFESKEGAMRPDLSYLRPQVAAADN